MKPPNAGGDPDTAASASHGQSPAGGHMGAPSDLSIRNELRPGDLGSLIALHGTLYGAECGWDHTFEAYVAGPLAQFALAQGARDRIWIVERQGEVAGSIAIVELNKKVAQLRWFLLDVELRGRGVGKRLLEEAIGFSRKCGYVRVELWTASNLAAAAHLYRSAGFELVREITHPLWGRSVTEQQYELRII